MPSTATSVKAWRDANREKSNAIRKRHYDKHRDEIVQAQREYRATQRAAVRASYLKAKARPGWSVKRRENQLRVKYGLSAGDYSARLAAQSGVCAICAEPPPSGKFLCVDHDHKTGAVRALLCNSCNSGIGYLGDSPARLRAGAEYLERFNLTTRNP